MEARRAALRERLALARKALDQLDDGGDREKVATGHGMKVGRLLQIIRLLELSPSALAFVESATGPLPPERVFVTLTVLSESEQVEAIQEWLAEAAKTGRWS